MAYAFETDPVTGQLALLINQAVFGYLAPTNLQTDAQVRYIETYNGLVQGLGFAAPGVEQLIKVYIAQGIGTFGGLGTGTPTTAQLQNIVRTAWLNIYNQNSDTQMVTVLGKTTSVTDFMINAYAKYGADAEWIIPLNIVLQFANQGAASNDLTTFLHAEAAGNAEYGASLYSIEQKTTFVNGDGVYNGSSSTDNFIAADAGNLTGAVIIDGGFSVGTPQNDKLTISGGGTTGAFFMSNVPTVDVNGITADATVNLVNTTGVAHLIKENTGNNVTFNNVQSSVLAANGGDVSITNTSGQTHVNFTAAAVAGTNDTLNIMLNGAGIAAARESIYTGGVEHLVMKTSGTASFIGSIVDGATPATSVLKDLTVSGSAAININGFAGPTGNSVHGDNNNITLVDLSGLTANSFVAVEGTGMADINYKGGSANDIAYIGSELKDGFAAAFSMDGGAGTNKLGFSTFADVGTAASVVGSITHFQNAIFYGDVSGGTLHVDTLDKIGVSVIELNQGGALFPNPHVTAGNLTFNGVTPDTTHTLQVDKGTTLDPGVTLVYNIGDGSGIIPTGDGAHNNDVFNLDLSATNTSQWLSLVAPQLDSMNISVNGANGTFNTVFLGNSDSELFNVTLTEGANAGGALETFIVNDGAGVAGARALTIDGQALSAGTQLWGILGAAGGSILGGAANDIIDGSNVTNVAIQTMLNGGLGADTLFGSATGHETFVIQETNGVAFTSSIADAALDTVNGFVTAASDKIHFNGLTISNAATQVKDIGSVAGTTDVDLLNAANSALAAVPGLKVVEAHLGASADNYVFADTNGDGLADSVVKLVGAHAATTEIV